MELFICRIQAGCKKCKGKIEKGEIRIAKITKNAFSDDGDMKLYHHPKCIFDTFKKARATTKIIEDPTDLEGWEDVEQKDREMILKLIKETDRGSTSSSPSKTPTKKAPAKSKKSSDDGYEDPSSSTSGEEIYFHHIRTACLT